MNNNKFIWKLSKNTLWTAILLCTISNLSYANDKEKITAPQKEEEITISLLGEFEGGGPGGGTVTEVPEVNALAWEGVEERLHAYDNNLMGDSVDLATGSLAFSQTDISLPGNSALEVAIRRKTSGKSLQPESSGFLADWQLDIPYISMLMQEKSSNGSYYNWPDRCTSNSSPDTVNSNWGIQEYWEGLNISIPGRGSERILDFPDTQMFGTHAPSKSTKSHLLISCINDIGTSKGGGEGFLVKTTDGTEYRFDVLSFLEARPAKKGTEELKRRLGVLYASQVTDKDGNTVTYTYNSSKRLTQIDSSDGRKITLVYNSSGHISSVTANGRTWTYSYATASGNNVDNSKTLTKVTQPDGRYWSFSFYNWRTNTLPGHCTRLPFTISMTHPYGTSASFTLTETRFGKSGVQNTMKTQNEINGLRGCYEDYIHHTMPWFENLAVTEKVLSGPSIDTATWAYQYQSDNGNFSTVESSTDLRKTTVTDPLNQKTEYYHNRRWGVKNGQLEKIINYDADGSVLRETNNTYITKDGIFGTVIPNLAWVDTANHSTAQYLTKSVITQVGDTYTTEQVFNTNPSSSSYSYGLPTENKTYSNINTSPRHTLTTYKHIKDKWILGLSEQITTNNRDMQTNVYDSYGRKTEAKAYGYTVASFGYHTNSAFKGALSWVKDADNRTTYAYDWKRGKPQQVKRPDGKSVYLTVDNNGWVTESIDALGRSTLYDYDDMGRNTLVNPPGSWSSTSTSFSFGNTHIQTITKANARSIITYDNLFRPILEETKDLLTGESTFVNFEYDTLSQKTFSSFSSFSATESSGTEIEYDGLGRVITESETVSPYATTTHQYLASHTHRITDPLGDYIDYYAYGYDGPGSDNYREIRVRRGDGTTQSYTVLTQNIWGQTTKVRQHGSLNGYSVNQSRYYYYDSRQRLCRKRETDVGDSVYQYNNSGWLMAYQKGLSSGTSCATPSGTAKVSFVRDSLGRATKTDFTDGNTPDINRTFDDVGNLKTINRGGANWTYDYNEINLLESESVSIDGYTFAIDYSFNTAGHLESKTLPSGKVVNYSPDGLGRATKATIGTSNYATSIDYHASGAIKSFTYGNGFSFSQTLNARTLPKRLLSQYGSTKALDLNYTYDAKSQVTTINDGAVSGNNRVNTYDAAGQLITASGPWGSGSFTYDSLGNIREKSLGSRNIDITYNSAYRATQSADSGATGTRAFNYDNRGNVTQAGGLYFTYDYADQPRTMSGNESGTYVYDGNLKRIKSTINGSVIYNVYDQTGSLVLIENDGQNKTTEYISVAGMNVARIENSSVTFLHNDSLGSPIAGTLSNRTVDWREKFTPFGIPLVNDSANDDQAGFTGHIKDSETGLVYMQARYYDPVIGRFYSNDPVDALEHFNTPNGPVHGFNRYAYANNNPYTFIDPTGMSTEHPYIEEMKKRVQPSLCGCNVVTMNNGNNDSQENTDSDDGLTIDDDGSGAIEITVDTEGGEITIIGNPVIDEDGERLTLDGTHIDGPGKDSIGISGVRDIGRRLGKRYGVNEVVVQGGKRNTGAKPGKVPIPIKVKVNR